VVEGRKHLSIPRDATFPSLPFSEEFGEYSDAYYLAAKQVWDTCDKSSGGPVPVPMPDNLVFPILFLIHHYLELELKQAITLCYSIGDMTGKLTPGDPDKTHDLSKLLTSMESLLAKLDGVPDKPPFSEESRALIEDINEFGMLGEALRYPHHTVNSSKGKELIGPGFLMYMIVDIAAVMPKVEKASHEFNGLIGFLCSREQSLFEAR
jgi:hypothetical protein